MVSILFVTIGINGEYLVCLSKENKANKEVITLISGSRDPGESDLQTLFREVNEEVKLSKTQLRKLLYRNSKKKIKYIQFGGGRIYLAIIPPNDVNQFLSTYKTRIESAYTDLTLPSHLRELITIDFYQLDQLDQIVNASGYLKSIIPLLQKLVPKYINPNKN